MTPTDIRDYIAQTMQTRGITQTELAVKSGIEQANISRYLNSDPTNVVSPTALRLLDALGLELTVKAKDK
jgi:transcriptional regulator with XRE-family HTH domain